MMYFCTQLLDWGWLRKLDFSISAPNYVLGMTPLTTLVGRTQHFLVMSRKIVTKILLKLYRTLFYLNYIKTVQSRLVCQSLSLLTWQLSSAELAGKWSPFQYRKTRPFTYRCGFQCPSLTLGYVESPFPTPFSAAIREQHRPDNL
jgi:hypothetical protein